ncbi:MAG: helix-turn-helix domain-containing protein [Thermodesulfobacteriota bacterium]
MASIGKQQISSGIQKLDQLLQGLFIGDNVIWYDQAGSLAPVFCLNFIKASQAENKPIVYVSVDRSPRNLLEQLGPLADSSLLTVLDCFTWGKGAGSDVFLSFYYDARTDWPCRIVRIDEPQRVEQVMDRLYGVHSALEGDVRFIFESLTGMEALWGGEQNLLNFYSHSCPRLYELNTVAYWIVEKDVHSQRMKAQINQIAQVVIDLSVKRGRTSLSILKAEKRGSGNLHREYTYWSKDLTVTFEKGKRSAQQVDLGSRLKEARKLRGLSQNELGKLVGVTPSTISQIESNLIYPSLPALLKMAEVLTIDIGFLFSDREGTGKKIVFPSVDAPEVRLPTVPEGIVSVKALIPEDLQTRAEPYLIEVAPGKELPAHFFVHKGEEMGYLLSGKLEVVIEDTVQTVRAGDLVYLTTETPSQWRNPGPGAARLLWAKLK